MVFRDIISCKTKLETEDSHLKEELSLEGKQQQNDGCGKSLKSHHK